MFLKREALLSIFSLKPEWRFCFCFLFILSSDDGGLCFFFMKMNEFFQVCTFKLVLKNAASLLDDKDPVILEAENILNDLVR